VFADDIALVFKMVTKHGPVSPPFVECGGLESPTIADYQRTIDAMAAMRPLDIIERTPEQWGARYDDALAKAQHARYLQIRRPLESTLPGYVCEDPGAGGLPIELLAQKYDRSIGVAILLSVLEHVDRPWEVPGHLVRAMRPGGLIVVSVPWAFPWHGSPEDHYRYSPTGLRHVFKHEAIEIIEAGWRLDVPAEAGVKCIRTGRAQIIQSAYLVARVRT